MKVEEANASYVVLRATDAADWSETTLGEVADFEMGQAPPGSNCNKEGNGTVFVKAGEFGGLYPVEVEWTTKPLKFGKKGDVFICVVGATAGKLNLGIDCAIGRSVAAIRPKEGIDTKFIYYQLQPWVLKLRASSSGSAQGVISKAQLSEVPLLVAPLDQQKRIVAEIEKQFSRLDEAVANLKRVKTNLKRYKAAVLKAAVEGRLVETEAELARREGRSFETGAQLLQRILETRRSQWQGKGKYKEPVAPDTADLPELPEGWVWASLDQLTSKITSGSRDWSQYYGRGTGIFVLAQNVRPFNPDFSVQQFVDPPSSDSSCDRSRIQDGDLLATIVGANAGQICLVTKAPCDAYVCQSVALIRPVLLGTGAHLNYWLNSAENGQRYLDQCMYGQGRPHLSFEQLMSVPIALPPMAEQQRIVAEVDRCLSLTDESESQVNANLLRAVRLRQAILARAFSGTRNNSNRTHSENTAQAAGAA